MFKFQLYPLMILFHSWPHRIMNLFSTDRSSALRRIKIKLKEKKSIDTDNENPLSVMLPFLATSWYYYQGLVRESKFICYMKFKPQCQWLGSKNSCDFDFYLNFLIKNFILRHLKYQKYIFHPIFIEIIKLL